jgi:hypothetical protein
VTRGKLRKVCAEVSDDFGQSLVRATQITLDALTDTSFKVGVDNLDQAVLRANIPGNGVARLDFAQSGEVIVKDSPYESLEIGIILSLRETQDVAFEEIDRVHWEHPLRS